MNLHQFLSEQRRPREPAAELLRRWIRQKDWASVRAFAQEPGSLAALNSTPTAERDFGQALAMAGRWRELWAFEQSQPERLGRLIEGADLLALPRTKVFGLPATSVLRQQALMQAAEDICNGDMELWAQVGQDIEVRTRLFEHRPIDTFLALCTLKEEGRPVDPLLWAMSQESLRDEQHWVVRADDLTQDGDINHQHGTSRFLNVLDACCQHDHPRALTEALKLAPVGAATEYLLAPQDRTGYQNTGFGLVNSLLQRGSDACLIVMQNEDPTFLFRPRQFWRRFGGPEDGLRYPLSDLLDASVLRRLNRMSATIRPDGSHLSVLNALLNHLEPWGKAILTSEHHAAWTEKMAAAREPNADVLEALQNAIFWIRKACPLEPVVCTSQAQHQLSLAAVPSAPRRPRVR